MKKINFVFVVLFILSFHIVHAQYKNVPNTYLDKYNVKKSFSFKNMESFKDITSSLPANYSKNGDVDYTAYIQKAINNNRNVIMPNFPVLISDVGIKIPSNSNIYFQSGSKLIMKPSSKGDDSRNQYYALLLYAVENVNILNVKIEGDRLRHRTNKGEWGMGIAILGSKNVSIKGGSIYNCWGDGIYIGNINRQSDKYPGYKIPSNNVNLNNLLVDNNRRNAISVTSGVSINISNVIASNSNGTLPMSGIDIEPNGNFDLIRDLNLSNFLTFNNKKDGLLLALTKGTSRNKSEIVGINVNGHVDIASYSPLRIGSGFRKNDKKYEGNILIKNSSYYQNKVGVRYNENNRLLPQIKVQDVKFSSFKNQAKSLDDKYKNGTDFSNIRF